MLRDTEVRVAFQTASAHDTLLAKQIVELVVSAARPHGLPLDFSVPTSLTVALVDDLHSEADAVAYPEHHTIVLPLDRVRTWDVQHLRNVLLHEWTHLAVRTNVPGDHLTPWLDEGFAEWSVGGVSCDILSRLYVSIQLRKGAVPLRLELDEFENRRLAYDYFTEFIGYLESRHSGLVSSGRLLQALRSTDPPTALHDEIGVPFGALVEQWSRHIEQRVSSATYICG